MDVTITREDCDNGISEDCRACALALAAQRLFPSARLVQVGCVFLTVFPQTPEPVITYEIDQEGRDFIEEYDKRHGIMPPEFQGLTVSLIPFDPQS